MNKLYYLLIIFSLVSLFSCDDDDPVKVYMQYEESDMTANTITPEKGYVGEQITITGTNFGASKQFMKVFIGDFEANVISCSEQKIVAEVPEEAVTGKIILELLGKKIATDLIFTILDHPTLQVSELSGYRNGEVLFTGTNMPATENYLTVKFDDYQAEFISYDVDESGNGTFRVKVPSRLSEGTVKLTVSLLGGEIYNKNYRILASPTIDSRESWLGRSGQMIVLTGTGLSDFADKIKIDFNGIQAIPDPGDISDTQIEVQVPAGFAGGKVSVELEGFPTVEVGELQILTAGDVTAHVLKNSIQPFKRGDGSTGDWAIPADWKFNDAFGTDPAIHFPSSVPNGLLSMQAGWGRPNKVNAKMYQVVTLPAGTYTFTLNVAECGSNGGEFGVVFAVAKGNAAIPDLSKVGGVWTITDTGNVFDSYRITDRKEAHQQTVQVILSEETEVTIGFVAQITNQGWVKLSSIGVTLEQ